MRVIASVLRRTLWLAWASLLLAAQVIASAPVGLPDCDDERADRLEASATERPFACVAIARPEAVTRHARTRAGLSARHLRHHHRDEVLSAAEALSAPPFAPALLPPVTSRRIGHVSAVAPYASAAPVPRSPRPPPALSPSI
jgi:hypothetical protein